MIHELKPITKKVRTLGWKPKIDPPLRMPNGTLEFADDEHREGLFAYGKHHDYCIRIDGETRIGRVGQWAEELLYDGEPDWTLTECKAVIPNATTNQLIRIAEQWENGKATEGDSDE